MHHNCAEGRLRLITLSREGTITITFDTQASQGLVVNTVWLSRTSCQYCLQVLSQVLVADTVQYTQGGTNSIILLIIIVLRLQLMFKTVSQGLVVDTV